jgi:ankyrin repeat protein
MVNVLESAKNAEFISAACKLGADIEARNNYGHTPLYAHINEPSIIRALIENGADVKVTDEDVNTLLHQWDLPPDVVALLVDAGCPINAENKVGRTPLECVSTNCLGTLLSFGADGNRKNPNGLAPLHTHKTCEAIKTPLQYGAEVDVRDDALRTPLMYSGQYVLRKNARHLLDTGADPRATDKDKMTPLHFVCGAVSNNDFVHGSDYFVKALNTPNNRE